MNSTQILFFEIHLAEALFDWVCRCRQTKLIGEAISEHLRSLRHGKEAQNNAALLKLYRLALIPRQRAVR